MAASQNQDFVTYAGNRVQPLFTVYDDNGVPLDISAATEITFQARRDLDTAVVVSKTKTASGGIAFYTDGTDGKFVVTLSATDTASLTGYYIYEAVVTCPNPITVSTGRMQVGQVPVWTYDVSQLATKQLYQVRRMVGDVLQADQQMSDSEVNYAISLYSNSYLAAAECCRQIAAQYSRKVDTVQGELRTLYSSQAKAYALRAAELEQRGMTRGGGSMPYIGGISVSDKGAQINDPDRVTPQFNIGMNENLLPVGVGVGNETPGNPAGGNGETGSGPQSGSVP